MAATDYPRTLKYPKNLDDDDTQLARISFLFFERTSILNSYPSDEVIMYMPESASNPNTVSWDNKEMGYVVGTVANSEMSWGSAGRGAMGFAQKLALEGIYNTASAGAALTGSKATSEDIMGITAKVRANPFLTMLFRGVDFRSFAMVFKFTPVDYDDCERIRDIINCFDYHKLPSRRSPNSPYLGYPNEVEVKYQWGKGKENPWLKKFKRCNIQSVEHDYTPNSMFSTMRNGHPSQITMSIKFSENELVTREDIEKGY